MTLLSVDGANDAVADLHDVAGDPGEQRENQKVTSKKHKKIVPSLNLLLLVAPVDDGSSGKKAKTLATKAVKTLPLKK